MIPIRGASGQNDGLFLPLMTGVGGNSMNQAALAQMQLNQMAMNPYAMNPYAMNPYAMNPYAYNPISQIAMNQLQMNQMAMNQLAMNQMLQTQGSNPAPLATQNTLTNSNPLTAQNLFTNTAPQTPQAPLTFPTQNRPATPNRQSPANSLLKNMGQEEKSPMNTLSLVTMLISSYSDMIFEKHDANKSGFLDVHEIYPAVCELFHSNGLPNPTYSDVLKIMKQFDSDGNGLIDKKEFRKILLAVSGLS